VSAGGVHRTLIPVFPGVAVTAVGAPTVAAVTSSSIVGVKLSATPSWVRTAQTLVVPAARLLQLTVALPAAL
jgi:hypothetical protein